MENCWITARQIEASRVAMTRFIKRGGKIWIRVFPDKPITKKPTEVRMGKGKGAPEAWVAVIKAGPDPVRDGGRRRDERPRGDAAGRAQAADQDEIRDPAAVDGGMERWRWRLDTGEASEHEFDGARQGRSAAARGGLEAAPADDHRAVAGPQQGARGPGKDLARVLTIKRERELAGRSGTVAGDGERAMAENVRSGDGQRRSEW